MPNPSEEQSLLAISIQCPIAAGDAVYEARMLLGYRLYLVYDDEASCAVAQGRSQSSEQFIPSHLSIYPNPTSDYILLDAYIGKEMQLTDALGRIVLQQKVNAPLLNVSQIQRGIYQLCIWDENTRMTCNSIVISEKQINTRLLVIRDQQLYFITFLKKLL